MGRAKPAFSTSLHFPSTLQFIIIPQRVAIEEDRGGLLFRRALSALGKKGSDGFFFFLFGKGGEAVHAAVECAPPLRPKCERPLLLLLLLLFGWAVSARGLKGEEEEEGRPLLHCHGYVGVYAERTKIQARKTRISNYSSPCGAKSPEKEISASSPLPRIWKSAKLLERKLKVSRHCEV